MRQELQGDAEEDQSVECRIGVEEKDDENDENDEHRIESADTEAKRASRKRPSKSMAHDDGDVPPLRERLAKRKAKCGDLSKYRF